MKKQTFGSCISLFRVVLSLFIFVFILIGAAQQTLAAGPDIPVECCGQVRCFRPADLLSGTQEAGKTVNILLIGQDQRPGEPGKRSDSIILCSIRPSSNTLTITSFLRDAYVKIPGHGSNRINAAYAFGGRELLKRTLNENFGVTVDGCIEVDFDRFAEIVDALGGVTLELREDEAREINKAVPWQKISAGRQKMSGHQTLAYSRIRKLDADSDVSRTQRQRKVLNALVDQYRDLNFRTMMVLVGKVLPALDTDLSTMEILSLGKMVLPMMENLKIVSQRIPAEGACVDRKVNGMAVLIPDLEKSRSLLQDTLTP